MTVLLDAGARDDGGSFCLAERTGGLPNHTGVDTRLLGGHLDVNLSDGRRERFETGRPLSDE